MNFVVFMTLAAANSADGQLPKKNLIIIKSADGLV